MPNTIVRPRAELEEIIAVRSIDWSDDERAQLRGLVKNVTAAYGKSVTGDRADFAAIVREAQALAKDRRTTGVEVLTEWVRTTAEHLCMALEGRRVPPT